MVNAQRKERALYGARDNNVVVITPQMAGVKKAVNPFAPEAKRRSTKERCQRTMQTPIKSKPFGYAGGNSGMGTSRPVIDTLDFYWEYVHHEGELSKLDLITAHQTAKTRIDHVCLTVSFLVKFRVSDRVLSEEFLIKVDHADVIIRHLG